MRKAVLQRTGLCSQGKKKTKKTETIYYNEYYIPSAKSVSSYKKIGFLKKKKSMFKINCSSKACKASQLHIFEQHQGQHNTLTVLNDTMIGWLYCNWQGREWVWSTTDQFCSVRWLGHHQACDLLRINSTLFCCATQDSIKRVFRVTT